MTVRQVQRSAAEQAAAEHAQKVKPLTLSTPPRAGDLCPRCGAARVDYDGLLNLACPACGFTLNGCFT